MRHLHFIAALGIASEVLGSFSGGVDTFDGTTKDSAAWAEFRSTAAVSITQNDALVIDALGGVGEYRSSLVRVGVGGWVRVKATVTAAVPPPAGSIEAYLAFSSAPPPAARKYTFSLGSTSLTETFAGQSDFMATIASSNGSLVNLTGNALSPRVFPDLNQTYHLRMDVVDADHVQYRVFDTAMILLSSRTELFGGLPQLYLTLGAEKARVEFDDFTIGGNVVLVPEPAGVITVIAGLVGFGSRRSRQHRPEQVH